MSLPSAESTDGSVAASAHAFAEGPAFPRLVKGLSCLLVLSLLAAAWRLAMDTPWSTWPGPTWVFILATMGLIGYCQYWILFSRTRIDNRTLSQTWMWPKQIALADITQAKFIYLPYLAWLIAPRLVLRVRGHGVVVFHAAQPNVMQAFARLSLGFAEPVTRDPLAPDASPDASPAVINP